MKIALAYVAGALFGVGLVLSGMTDPAKVIAFLDVTQVYGAWDASLMFVMVGAIGVHAVTRRWVVRRPGPVFGDGWHVPTRKDVDARLLAGAAIFGAGWGLAGYCPGPAVVSAAGGLAGAALFVATMLAGMIAYEVASPRPEFGQ